MLYFCIEFNFDFTVYYVLEISNQKHNSSKKVSPKSGNAQILSTESDSSKVVSNVNLKSPSNDSLKTIRSDEV